MGLTPIVAGESRPCLEAHGPDACATPATP